MAIGQVLDTLWERGSYDTRKENNRSGRVISQEILESIERDGITSEQLDELGLPVFKYKTQLTIHGIFPALDTDRLGEYKMLIRNGNGSLGVKYNAVDYAKKDTIYTCMKHCGYTINKNSQEFIAYKMGECGQSRENVLKDYHGFENEKNNFDLSLFTGSVNVKLYNHEFFGYFAALVVEIHAIYQDKVDAAILNLCGRNRDGIESEIEEENRKYQIERDQRLAEIDAASIAAEKLKVELLAKSAAMAENNGLVKAEKLQAGRYIVIDAVGGAYIYRVREIFKWGSDLKSVSKRFDTLKDAIDFNGEIPRKHAAPVYSLGNAFIKDTKKDTLGSVIIRRNMEKAGIEIVFSSKPAQNIIDSLNAHDFRYSGRLGLWYKKYTELDYTFAKSLRG